MLDLDKLQPFDHATLSDLPPGWQRLGDLAIRGASRVGAGITRMYYIKGILRFEVESDDVTSYDLARRICETIARDSARTCMVCGTSGYRRKGEDGWPCLCRVHYVEYANALDQLKHEREE